MPLYRPDPRQPSGGWDPFGRAPPDGWPWWRRVRWTRAIVGLLIASVAAQFVWRGFERPLSVRFHVPPSPIRQIRSSAEVSDPRRETPRPAKPIDSPAFWVTSDDYSVAALRENLEGLVTIRFRIDRAGRVIDCTVAQSSGSPILDNTTCGIVEQHGHYWPARNRAGQALEQAGTLKFRWVIPS